MINQLCLLAMVAFLLAACSLDVNVTNHDEFLAGNTAADFLEAAFLEKNSEKAYSFAHDLLKTEMPKQDFIAEFSRMADSVLVTHIEAVSFELVESSDLIAVYFTVRNSFSDGIFRVAALGDGSSYKVVSFKTVNKLPTFTHSMAGTYAEAGKRIERGNRVNIKPPG